MKKYFILLLAVSFLILPEAGAAGNAGKRKALVVMLDGARADAVFFNALMPRIRKFMDGKWQKGYRAAFSDSARIIQDAFPHSAPNHASIATGVTGAKHKVIRNGLTQKGNFDKYPHFLGHLVKRYPELKTAFFHGWKESGFIRSNDERVKYVYGSDYKNVNAAVEFLKDGDAAVIYINYPDGAGHNQGFYPCNSSYLGSLNVCDYWASKLLTAIAARPGFAGEEWMIVIVADHGGYHLTHGGEPYFGNTTTIPFIVSSKSVKSGKIAGVVQTCDVAATVLDHFGISPAELDLDGRAVGKAVQPVRRRKLRDGVVKSYDFQRNITSVKAEGKVSIAKHGCFWQGLEINGGTCTLTGTESAAFENRNNFTVTFWAKFPAGLPVNARLISNQPEGSAAGGPGMTMYIKQLGPGSTEPGICLDVDSSSSKNKVRFGQFDRLEGWNFYAVTITPDGKLYFVNGGADGFFYYMAIEAADTAVATGLPFVLGGKGFNGVFDDVTLWQRGLSIDELNEIYRTGRIQGKEMKDMLR